MVELRVTLQTDLTDDEDLSEFASWIFGQFDPAGIGCTVYAVDECGISRELTIRDEDGVAVNDSGELASECRSDASLVPTRSHVTPRTDGPQPTIIHSGDHWPLLPGGDVA